MSEHNDGGPAFPSGHAEPGLSGMSIRDYFAIRTLAAMLANPQTAQEITTEIHRGKDLSTLRRTICNGSYDFADAMLKARARGEPL